MRGAPHSSPRQMTIMLMIINTVILVLNEAIKFYHPAFGQWIHNHFALSLWGLQHGYLWQLFTFQFLHAGLWHLLFNLLAIYFFGGAVEQVLGRRRFLRLYLMAGVAGGVAQMFLAVLFPQFFNGPVLQFPDGRLVVGGAVVGASAGAFGLVAAFATLFPEYVITLLVFFVLPVSMRARTLLWISAGLAVFGILVPLGNIADGAHLGGLLAGVAYIKWRVLNPFGFGLPSIHWPWRRIRIVRNPSRPPRSETRPPPVPAGSFEPEENFFAQVDAILDKISAHGIHSLTERERKILEDARSRMARR